MVVMITIMRRMAMMMMIIMPRCDAQGGRGRSIIGSRHANMSRGSTHVVVIRSNNMDDVRRLTWGSTHGHGSIGSCQRGTSKGCKRWHIHGIIRTVHIAHGAIRLVRGSNSSKSLWMMMMMMITNARCGLIGTIPGIVKLSRRFPRRTTIAATAPGAGTTSASRGGTIVVSRSTRGGGVAVVIARDRCGSGDDSGITRGACRSSIVIRSGS
mmetsp:Transcript_29348/g.53712  ORF Transcript_29348/g.53712 Transcript_29348/m.53712 type:complete len:211 (-) Transcript_29348:399-1031(-)